MFDSLFNTPPRSSRLQSLQHRCFPVKFAKFLKEHFFLQNVSGGCFWPMVFTLTVVLYNVQDKVYQIQSKYGKIRTRKTPYMDTFYTVLELWTAKQPVFKQSKIKFYLHQLLSPCYRRKKMITLLVLQVIHPEFHHTILDKELQRNSRNYVKQVFLWNVLQLIFCDFLIQMSKFSLRWLAGHLPSGSGISKVFLISPISLEAVVCRCSQSQKRGSGTSAFL